MAVIIEKPEGGAGGGSVFLAFVVGALLLAAGVIGFFMWDNYKSGGEPHSVTITAPTATPNK